MSPISMNQEALANTVIAALEKRQMAGYYCATKEEALEKAISFAPKNGIIGLGGSESLKECGIVDALRSRNDLTVLSKAFCDSLEEAEAVMRQTFSADSYYMSTNAITVDGKLINIDNTGNRVASLIFGPKDVIIVAGMNKVAFSEEEAISRARNMAAPPNCVRLNRTTPCTKTGHCMDCLADGCLCNHIVITRRSLIPERIKVILVGESLGY